jgi:hypothetical protein
MTHHIMKHYDKIEFENDLILPNFSKTKHGSMKHKLKNECKRTRGHNVFIKLMTVHDMREVLVSSRGRPSLLKQNET